MVQYFPPPDCRSLLPPLLACLPTAFISPRPPPALLPLLTPILRQRVKLLSATSTSSSDTWLPLLCWETEPAQRLVDIVSQSSAFELHPVSGEIDFGDLEQIRYKRLDEETLQARVVIIDLEVTVIYQWCEGDQEGGADGWRVSEIRPTASGADSLARNWSSSVAEANETANEKAMDDALRNGEDQSLGQATINGAAETNAAQDDDNNDDYWASYDKTPGPMPDRISQASRQKGGRPTRSTSEDDYFAQYAEVQPEMDNDDPSEDRHQFGESTLNGDTLPNSIQDAANVNQSNGGESLALPNGAGVEDANAGINQPIASSPQSRRSTVSNLEDSAETQSIAESAIMHHVGTSIKSLYRLCRSSGIEKSEFERMIRNEMDTLSMMDEDD